MIYMCELDFSKPQYEIEWNVWYSGHLRTLLGIRGFRTAQRFKADMPATSPFLAMYEIDSPSILSSEAYRACGGRTAPGEWAALMVDWHRNLFDGVDHAPAVPRDSSLLVVDWSTHSDCALPLGLSRLRCVGLDHTVGERWIGVFSVERARELAVEINPGHARIFRPITPQIRN